MVSVTCKANSQCFNGVDACNCDAGYESDDAKANDCTDIDECNTTVESGNQHNCHAETTCTNTPAAASTCTWNSSFWEGDGETSTDVDECDENVSHKHDCDGANELCSNKDNGFDCVCAAGYERATAGDANSECVSISECATTTCDDTNASCVELEGVNTGYGTDGTPDGGVGFSCECNTFFTMNADTKLCRNYNECGDENDAATHNCHDFATCTDGDGNGFTCECNSGYAGDGYLSGTGCADVDECTNIDATGKTLAVNCGNMADGTNQYDVQACSKLTTAEGRYSCSCTTNLVAESTNDGEKETCVDIN